MQVISMTQSLAESLNTRLGQQVFGGGDAGKILVVTPDSFRLEHNQGVTEWNIGRPPVALFKDGSIVVNRGTQEGRYQVEASVATQIIEALLNGSQNFLGQGLSVATS